MQLDLDITQDDTIEVALDTTEICVVVGKGTAQDNTVNLVKISNTPDSWSTPDNNEERGEPAFSEVDNLGDWDSFAFCPKFKKEYNAMRYNGHYLPT